MDEPSPEFLLDNGDLVEPVAPWCVWLDNVELAILLLLQPWMAAGGLRRAELERQLQRLAVDMPLRPIYFQRVSRAVASLEDRGQVRGRGAGRSRVFTVTPRGFAALLLNLQVVRSDPTIDGAEFEFKRALVAVCNLVMERLAATRHDVELGAAVAGFLEDVERLEIWGRPVISDRVLAEAFDVLHLIDVQRQRVGVLLAGAEDRLERARTSARLMTGPPPRIPAISSEPDDTTGAQDLRRLVDTLWPVAVGVAPELAATAAVTRYQAYLVYLERLASLYSNRLGVVDLTAFRRSASGRE
jgi:hypothetical protein